MPYTPPSRRSPASSATTSPDVSRRNSYNGSATSSPVNASRPALPRSASYLTKHRRTPSASSNPPSLNTSTPDITPPGTSENLRGMVANSGSVRQSPPPMTDARSMPAGAIISPPESGSSSNSEDEEQGDDSRGRQLVNLKELQDAISVIPQHRDGSPTKSDPAADILILPSQISGLLDTNRNSFSATSLDGLQAAARKISHARSSTEPNITISKSADASPVIVSEDSDQDEPLRKPQMVRKKSGELVRPALRPSSRRRPSSMPGTPTFGKAVHFDSHLEHVRHFLQVDRPLAVSAGSSPADAYESDSEYPFAEGTRSPPYEWEIVINNFPMDTPHRRAQPVRVERIWLANDQKSLIGSIAVANLAFHKSVVCRFTFDYWKTTSEVTAEYSHEIRPKESEPGYDRFQFTLKLSDLANLESKTLFFCVRYNVNGQEYWDSNNHANFQVDFRKKMLPQNGKKNYQGAKNNALPRSNRRSNASTSAPRPKSMPIDLGEFGEDAQFFDQPLHEYLGENPTSLRLKSSKSTTALPSDNLSSRLSAPSGQAFANRYDFGASLANAMQAHKDSTSPSPRRGDGLFMKSHKKAPSFGTTTVIQDAASAAPKPPKVDTAVPASSGTDSPSAAIANSSYEEILNKYCFFNGSKQSSPQLKDGTLRSGRYDGVDEYLLRSPASTNSSSAGSPQVGERHTGGAMHHHMRLNQNLNPYFSNAQLPAIGASPSESPITTPKAFSDATPTARTPSPGIGFAPLTAIRG